MGQKVHSVTNANVYLNGTSCQGQASEVEVPNIPFKTVDHSGLGMIGTTELFSGIDKIEMTVKWNSFYPDVMKVLSDPTKPIKFQIRGSMEVWENGGRQQEQPVVIHAIGNTKQIPGGTFKGQEKVELSGSFILTYVKLVINGSDIYEIDVLNNICKVKGVDILKSYRANLGL